MDKLGANNTEITEKQSMEVDTRNVFLLILYLPRKLLRNAPDTKPALNRENNIPIDATGSCIDSLISMTTGLTIVRDIPNNNIVYRSNGFITFFGGITFTDHSGSINALFEKYYISNPEQLKYNYL
jgi:hypothetical protein